MTDIYFPMLLGHLVGDYLLQNNWMALNKGKASLLGYSSCTTHCVIYAAAVCAVMDVLRLDWFIFVAAGHFLLDKYSVGDWWLKVIGGRSPSVFVSTPAEGNSMTYLQAGFTAVVYAVADNTMHLLIMFFGWRMLWA